MSIVQTQVRAIAQNMYMITYPTQSGWNFIIFNRFGPAQYLENIVHKKRLYQTSPLTLERQSINCVASTLKRRMLFWRHTVRLLGPFRQLLIIRDYIQFYYHDTHDCDWYFGSVAPCSTSIHTEQNRILLDINYTISF